MGTLKVDNIQSSTDGSVTFPQGTLSSNGTANAPSISFTGNTNTGIYRIADSAIGISTGGTLRTRIDNSGIEVIDGSASTPSISFLNSSTTGLYRISADKIGFSANGARVGEFGVGYGGFTGNIIQYVVASYSTQVTATTNTYKSVGFSCSITPKYSNSKILIIYMIGGTYGSVSGGATFKLYKNGSELSGSYEEIHAYGTYVGNFLNIGAKYTGFYLDSPGVTTSTSYEVYFNARNNTGTTYVQYNSSNSHVICLEIQQ